MAESDLALYPRLIRARIASQVQYRFSFALMVVGNLLLTGTDFAVIWVLFRHLPLLGGWSLSEIAFLYGTSYLSFKSVDLALGHLDQLGQILRMGTLDSVLTRPVGSLLQVATLDFATRQLGSIIQAGAVFAYALATLDISWDAPRVVMVAVMLVSAMAIWASIWVIGASVVFWTQGNGMEVLNTFTYGGNALTTYPINIYSAWLRRLLAFVVPLAFINYYPSLYILDKADPLGGPEILHFASPLVALVMVLLARTAWGMGIRHYSSTGS